MRSIRPLTWLVVLSVLALPLARPVGAAAQAAGGQLTITGTGQVKVDGAPAATGATIYSGSRITTPQGTTAALAIGGTRITLRPETDATITFAGGFARADVICGSVTSDPAAGTAYELITHGDTSVFVPNGTLQVQAEGRTVQLVSNQTQTFAGGVRITTTGPASFDASTILCNCLCAAVVPPPPVAAAGFPALLLLLLAGAGAAAAIIPVVIDDDEDVVVVSPSLP